MSARVLAVAQTPVLGGAELGLLRSAKLLPAHGFQVELTVPGEGPLAAAVRRAGPQVRLLGHVPAAELPALYAAADLLVVPSIQTATFTEPWGLVVNEAMLQRTPVIASDAVGAAAGGLVRDGYSGLVFPAGDSSALAERLAALASDPQLRSRLGRQAHHEAALLSPAAWAAGVSRALRSTGSGRDRPSW